MSLTSQIVFSSVSIRGQPPDPMAILLGGAAPGRRPARQQIGVAAERARLSWRDAELAPERAAEMRLARKPAIERDLGDRPNALDWVDQRHQGTLQAARL